MDEDRLNPQLGRLIDAAKAAANDAPQPGSTSAPAEGIAVMTRTECVHAGRQGSTPGVLAVSAAEAALEAVSRAGGGEVVAAAVAFTHDPAERACLSLASRRRLAAIDPDLPMVVKHRGRWVLLPLSRLPIADITISRVRHADHDLLVTLEAYDFEAFGATGLRTYDLAVMTQAGAVYLAQVDGEIVGSCQLLRVLDEPDLLYVVGFYIRPEWRGYGLGRAFLMSVAREVRELGAAGLALTVAPDNVAAMNLYRSAGFVDESFVPDFYGKGADRHIMRWRLEGEGLHGGVS